MNQMQRLINTPLKSKQITCMLLVENPFSADKKNAFKKLHPKRKLFMQEYDPNTPDSHCMLFVFLDAQWRYWLQAFRRSLCQHTKRVHDKSEKANGSLFNPISTWQCCIEIGRRPELQCAKWQIMLIQAQGMFFFWVRKKEKKHLVVGGVEEIQSKGMVWQRERKKSGKKTPKSAKSTRKGPPPIKNLHLWLCSLSLPKKVREKEGNFEGTSSSWRNKDHYVLFWFMRCCF